MSGTKAGARKGAKTLKERYGEDYFVRVGANGGRTSRGGGFTGNRELARELGSKGGSASRRSKYED